MRAVTVRSWARNARNLCTQKENARARIAAVEATKEVSRQTQPFMDSFHRKHTYLRISLTERCNLRCVYCMPEEGVELTPSDKLLRNDEILRLVQLFAERGVNKVRLTGGEPTIRKDLVELVGAIRSVQGINELGITSNGIVLERKLQDLVNAGLTHLNISLDTLDREKFTLMTRRNGFDKVWKCVEKAEKLLQTVKLNTVVMRGLNHEEVSVFVALTENRNLDVRFIEYMPFGGNKFTTKKFVGYQEMLDMIKTRYPQGLQKMPDKPNDTSKGQFGFITSMTENFCASCNRLRITADGNLKSSLQFPPITQKLLHSFGVQVCLHGSSEVNLLQLLRSGVSNEELSAVIKAAILRKKKQHAAADFRYRQPPASSEPTHDPHRWLNAGAQPQIGHRARPSQPLPLIIEPLFIRNLTASNSPFSKFSQRRLFSTINTGHDANEPKQLSHVGEEGDARQVDVSLKNEELRVAEAECRIHLTPVIVQSIESNSNTKGNVLCVARIAGINAAKQTGLLIPLAHPLPCLTTSITFDLNETVLTIRSRVSCRASTGVEMEALTACALSALTVYDMCKALSHSILITDLRLLSKSGGRSGFFTSFSPLRSSPSL